ncbi:Uncharacterised protein [Haemophilus parahaemolyticus]|uniref:Uncharacterized protein n=1 Tax=Haemophilus parahaemolyticus TaxID=735 RepID=A0A377I212_HAEPH|nr:Uncharacterised protein [Haemophilus parahaemolyticus]
MTLVYSTETGRIKPEKTKEERQRVMALFVFNVKQAVEKAKAFALLQV